MFRKTERDAKRRNTVSDEIRDDEAQQEDVEGHGLVNEPGVGAPGINREDDAGDDVEGHGLINEPGVGAPGITTRATMSRLTASSTSLASTSLGLTSGPTAAASFRGRR